MNGVFQVKRHLAMKQMWKRIGDRLAATLFMAAGIAARRLSNKQTYALARALGVCLYQTVKLRRKLVDQNLALAFPEKSATELALIAKKMYEQQAVNLLETLRLPLVKTPSDAKALFEIDPAVAERLCFQANRGGVVVSAHFANWEWMAVCWGLVARPMTIIYKPLSNQWLDETLNDWRTRCGNELVPMEQAARQCLKKLREGKLVAFLSDQASHDLKYFTPFLGRDAAVFLGAAVFALKTRSPMLLAMPIRIGDGKYRLEISEILTDDLDYNEDDVKRLAERYTNAIERYIRQYPAQWFWLHNRWKHAPPRRVEETAKCQATEMPA